MPEQPPESRDMETCLDFLEDYSLTTYQSRCVNYQKIQCSFYGQLEITETVARRLLEVCIHDLNEDMKYASIILTIIAKVLQKIKTKQCPMVQELVQSALAVLHIIKTTSLLSNMQALQALSFETFLAYPDETYIALVTNHCSEVTELFNLYFHQGIPVFLRIMAFQTLHLFLNTLPPEKKTEFVREGLNVWFSKVIPSTMTLLVSSQNPDSGITLDVLDILSAELDHIEYSDNPHWMAIMDCIYSQKYPSVMKSLLESGDERWHRIWILLVKLLKQQITIIKPKLGIPINSMLPVVEAAFKVDIVSRCHAFKCWSVLVDNFSAETNEHFVNKRIKLLMIPLKSNNANAVETALAKFDTWWHMIRKFEPRLHSHVDIIFIPFLQFCFGNPKHAAEKNVIVPGQLSLQLKKQSVQAFVESTGHIDCSGCIPDVFPKMSQGVLNPKVLQESLAQWILALKTVIKFCGSAECNSDEGKKQMSCIWKSFLSVVSRLQADAKKDVMGKLLAMVTGLVEECPNERGMLDLVFDVVLKTFLEEPQSRRMLDTVNESQTGFSGFTSQILQLIMNPFLTNYYSSTESKSIISKLTAFTNAILDDVLGPPSVSLELLLQQMPASNMGLLLWTALMKSVREIHVELSADALHKALIWPLNHVETFKNLTYAALVWNESYNLLRAKLQHTTMQKDMATILTKSNTALCDLSVFALLHVIKNNYDGEYKTNFKIDLPITANVLMRHNFVNCVNKEEIFRLAVDCSALMLSKIEEVVDVALVELPLNLANNSLGLLVQYEDIHGNDGCILHAEKLLVQLMRILKTIENVQLVVIPIEKILASYAVLKQQSALNIIAEILKIFLSKSTDIESPLYKKVTESMNLKKSDMPKVDKFAAPETSAKKKKKEPHIVSTVVENGEEYVVVKSNWKFNPRKLTENQKEKFQKKREDIPALYQDLSQSQDEFKLKSWKTDSQDTSTTNSITATSISKTGNKDSVSILQKMPSTDVLPKIMESNFSEKVTSDKKKTAINEYIINSDSKSPKSGKTLSLGAAKLKVPRVALKDRVFQNVKMLLEKSSKPSGAKTASKVLNQALTESVPKTPVSKTVSEPTAVYSAPPKISSDRPSRVKRKPKKFEIDFTDLSLKRRRNSVTVCNSQKAQDSGDMCDDSKCSLEVSNTITKLDNTIESTTKEESPKQVIEPGISKIPEKTTNTIRDPDTEHYGFIAVVTEDSTRKECQSNQAANSVPVTSAVGCDDRKVKRPKTKDDGPKITENEQKEPPLSQDANISTEVLTKEAKDCVKNTVKKPKKSRIESELAIDMVEGHPLFTAQLEKRTRKSLLGVISTRRKTLSEKLNKLPQSDSKLEMKCQKKLNSPKNKSDEVVKDLFAAKESQENSTFSSNELPDIMSEDFIESSQDSTFTNISVKSAKKMPIIIVENMQDLVKGRRYSPEQMPKNALENIQGLVKGCKLKFPQNNLSDKSTDLLIISPEKDDIEFSRNKSVEQDNTNNTIQDLTADFDTEPMDEKLPSSDDVIINNDDLEPVVISTEETYLSTQSQATAEADTQPNDSKFLSEMNKRAQEFQPVETQNSEKDDNIIIISSSETPMDTQDVHVIEITALTRQDVVEDQNESGLSSPFQDEEQRNKDFLNNTFEISPIKSLSPIQDDNKPHSPETSTDYVVVKLSSPVQCDGEPFEKRGSPEIFTEDKVSPDKRDLSPPRQEVSVNSSSPSSSLSLKKNKPQMKQGGRAAQMLGLCVPVRQNLINTAAEKAAEPEEPKKTALTPVRRNLRILYNCETNNNNSDENEESETFLKFKKALPTADCSPAGPILKRKLIDIADDGTISPASKRKRVSFHDPPVSTTMSVHKYIEPLGIRSPQSSVVKKQERQLRNANMKSPKKLENIFKLDTALTKTVESFIDPNLSAQSEDITMGSIDQTPSVEIVKASELNDCDPICPELVDCSDAISIIAAELSSPAMKSLLIKELEGHIQTIGDLAKLTELEVNRLCIKAPKVKIAKRVLSDYAVKQMQESQIIETVEQPIETEVTEIPSEMEVLISRIDMEVQTDGVSLTETEIQTDAVSVTTVHTQTKKAKTSSCVVQTNDSGSKTTEDIVRECLKERPDFVDKLASQLDESSKKKIVNDLPLTATNDVLSKKIIDPAEASMIIDSVLKNQEVVEKSECSDSFLQNYLLQRYETNDMILFCSQLLKKVHDRTT